MHSRAQVLVKGEIVPSIHIASLYISWIANIHGLNSNGVVCMFGQVTVESVSSQEEMAFCIDVIELAVSSEKFTVNKHDTGFI